MADSHLIIITLPQGTSTSYDLDEFHTDTVTLGRGAVHGESKQRNLIQLDSSCTMISRGHCSFRRDGQGSWYIVDDGSTNGLRYQNRRIKSQRLRDGDVFTVSNVENGTVSIRYSTAAPAPSQAKEAHKSPEGARGFSSCFSLQGLQTCLIGRSKDCNIVVNHPTASRRHCIITKEKGQYYITDNNSTNGVLLNAVPLQKKTVLKQGDRITISGISFMFRDGCLYTKESFGGVRVAAEQLCKMVGKKGRRKTITDNVSLTIEPNEFAAIIGGSGAGKTTLLNCLAGLTEYSSGEVLINDEPIRSSGKSMRSLIGYVPQQDIVYDSLTLERMLYYSAKLKMPRDSSESEIRSKIDETLELVELSAHRGTLISKLSGGERKRASIAVELLGSPRLFFLDEPSSGLDPGTEKHLMQLLRKLAATGKTVIMVTHTVQNLDLCDKVICMGRGGRLCFCGSPEETLRFFNKQALTDIYDELNNNSAQCAERFKRYRPQETPPKTHVLDAGKYPRTAKGMGALMREFGILMRRYVEILWSGRLRLTLLLVLPILLTILVCITFEADGGIYNVLKRMNVSIDRNTYPFLVYKDTMSLMFTFSCAAFWTGIFNSIQEISKERRIYERERFSGISAAPYTLSKFVPQTLLCFIQAAIMTAILIALTTNTITINGDVNSFTARDCSIPSDGYVLGEGMMWLETFLTTFLCVLSAMCLGLLISTLVSNEMALVLCPICLMPQILFSGVVGSLSGLTEILSQVITCKWSCLAYFVSAKIYDMYTYLAFKGGDWVETYDIELVDAAFEPAKEHIFGMNGVCSAWLVLSLMCIVFVAAATVILHFRRIDSR